MDGEFAVGKGGSVAMGGPPPGESMDRPGPGAARFPLYGYAPPLHPRGLGDPAFKRALGLDYAYIMGAMANGITSVAMVEAAGRAGMLGFFGAAGLTPDEIGTAIDRLRRVGDDIPFGFNLIHSPNDPRLEAATVRLYLERGVRLVSASAYLDLTLPLILYRVKGIHKNGDGAIVCPNRIIAKASRVEVAAKFFSPPPEKFLRRLINGRMITREEAALARSIPVAEYLTAEADSGGHTDNRPALTLLPTMLALRDEMTAAHGYDAPPRVGLGGGVATPAATAAAFAMGAAFVLTGSINQACTEAGASEEVRRMLAEARQADVAMAPSADMFEMGVKVQVLKRGTMFPLRAARLYELYQAHERWEEIPARQRETLERDMFRESFGEAWEKTRSFFKERDPAQIERAEKDPRHKMALVFRSYLGLSSVWAKQGDPSRKIDYQIWCGPAIGAFNQWVKGSFLEAPENRAAVTVAMNLLLGAAVMTRCNWLLAQGVPLPSGVGGYAPKRLSTIKGILNNYRSL
ncbi:MAG: PfaD family polyunsaturated fatty acid/polyketide biosynthesis protein [Desulfobacterales bacterium]|nr:PfaD family polyunsaturated fatty acid/polyketide biosynthesis protein [Desulfobacterales bacterium]